MSFFPTNVLRSVLTDLCDHQSARLLELPIGPRVVELLEHARADLEAAVAQDSQDPVLDDPLPRARALAEELRTRARASATLLSAFEADASLPEPQRATARALRERVFAPVSRQGRAIFAHRGASDVARVAVQDLGERLAELPAIGVSWPQRVETWLQVGDALTEAIRAVQAPRRVDRNHVRVQAGALFHRVRVAVLAWIRMDPQLPDELGDVLFAKYYEVAPRRAGRAVPRIDAPESGDELPVEGAPPSSAPSEEPAVPSISEPAPSVASSMASAASNLAEAAEDLAEAANEITDAA